MQDLSDAERKEVLGEVLAGELKVFEHVLREREEEIQGLKRKAA